MPLKSLHSYVAFLIHLEVAVFTLQKNRIHFLIMLFTFENFSDLFN